MKAIMKYPGSKWSIADWIISYFPEHHSYLEPFFGSGAVLLNKPRSNIGFSGGVKCMNCDYRFGVIECEEDESDGG